MNMESANSMSPVGFRAAAGVVFLEGNMQSRSNTDRGTLATLAESKKYGKVADLKRSPRLRT
jgi:hypothetical protein